MFVCHGNICRSPMAEFIFKDLAEKQGIADRFVVSSSATSTEEIWNGVGNPVYPPAKAELAKHGLSCNGKRGTAEKERLRSVRSLHRHGQRQYPQYAAHFRWRSGWEGAQDDGLYQPRWRCRRPVVFRSL